ncbi:MAG: PepSY domain-containing protein [Lachnospiraceae bacterium]|nr:PepSY domain-containing protein [Lachnospiraceae bacterium]
MKRKNRLFTTLTLTGLILTGCAAQAQTIDRIDLETAKAAAIEAAGFQTSEVSFVSTELDRKNDTEYYEIDFTVNGVEYDYDIDALTGKVISYEIDKKSQKHNSSSGTDSSKNTEIVTDTTSSEPSSKELTETEAKKIALAQVPGATESDIREFEVDYDDGRLEYDGSIYYGDMEYEFEIDGYSGAIRSWEVESIYD